MTSAIYTFMNQYGTKWNSIMAYGVLFDSAKLYHLRNDAEAHIVEGMTSGSVKG